MLATKADATLGAARELREAIGSIPVLSVASELFFFPPVFSLGQLSSLAERLQAELDGPVLAGLHSLAASTLGSDEPPDEDAFVCGDDVDAKSLVLEVAERLTAGRALMPARSRARALSNA